METTDHTTEEPSRPSRPGPKPRPEHRRRRLSVRLHPEVFRRLRGEAERVELTVSRCLERTLREHLPPVEDEEAPSGEPERRRDESEPTDGP